MSKSITITFDDSAAGLANYSDGFLATLWHAAQANPAPHGDRDAGEIAEGIGREIIRRWLRKQEPELWHHQGRDYFWHIACRAGKWDKDQVWHPNADAPGPQQPPRPAVPEVG